MITISGISKITALVAADFVIVYILFNDLTIAMVFVGVLVLYSWLGGYLSLMKDGAVRVDKLPTYDSARLISAKDLLANDIRDATSQDISSVKLYITPDDSLNATAYGCRCISINRGTLNNTDPITLAAVMAHELSHTINLDAEFNRMLFASVTALVLALSIISVLSMGILFFLFVILCCCSKTLRSWIGLILYQGSTKMVGGIFSIFQRIIIFVYQTVSGMISRASEYRADQYSSSFGYGLQLAHFLSIADSEPHQLTLTDILYRSHPPTEKRIYRLEQQNQQ